VITDAGGIPLAATLTGGNRHDVTQLVPLIEAIPPVRGCRGRPQRRPVQVFADRAYDHDKYRAARGYLCRRTAEDRDRQDPKVRPPPGRAQPRSSVAGQRKVRYSR
jgi:transposase